MNTKQDILRNLIVEHLGVEKAKVTMDATLEDLGADSLDTFELIMAIEKKFHIHFPDEDITKIGTMRETLAYLDSRAQEG